MFPHSQNTIRMVTSTTAADMSVVNNFWQAQNNKRRTPFSLTFSPKPPQKMADFVFCLKNGDQDLSVIILPQKMCISCDPIQQKTHAENV